MLFLWGPRLPPLNFVTTYSLSSTNNNTFQANRILNAIANPSQMIYQPHTATNKWSSASLLSSSFVPTVNLMNPPLVNTQNYTVPFVAMNKSEKFFLDFTIKILLEKFYIKLWEINPLIPWLVFNDTKENGS